MIDIETTRRRAKSFKASTSPWITDYDAMAQKTVLRQVLWRRVSLSSDVSAALQMDSANEGANPTRLYDIDPSLAGLADVAQDLGVDADGAPEASVSGAGALANELGGPGT